MPAGCRRTGQNLTPAEPQRHQHSPSDTSGRDRLSASAWLAVGHLAARRSAGQLTQWAAGAIEVRAGLIKPRGALLKLRALSDCGCGQGGASAAQAAQVPYLWACWRQFSARLLKDHLKRSICYDGGIRIQRLGSAFKYPPVARLDNDGRRIFAPSYLSRSRIWPPSRKQRPTLTAPLDGAEKPAGWPISGAQRHNRRARRHLWVETWSGDEILHAAAADDD